MADYLHAEGFAQGLPDKNSSWSSLLRRSEDWHRRIALRCPKREEERLEWDSLLPETVIDGVVCTPLTDSQALAEEGALKEPDGTRSTLGIWLNGKDGVSLDQHRGPHNSAVSRKAAAAAEKLLAAYRQAVTETL